MRKGLWSPDEDEKLRRCIAQHTSGSWSDIARKAGLQRCGKSCRRRWMNHLRPDLKHEKFTEEELKMVIKLHETLGNKWSEIATYLVGRTDNDVKNLWNTQIKKQLKNGDDEPIFTTAKTTTKRPCDGFLFAIDSHLDPSKHAYVEVPQTSISTNIPIGNHLTQKPWDLSARDAIDLNPQQRLDDTKKRYNLVSENSSPFLTSSYPPNIYGHSQACSKVSSRLNKELPSCIGFECNGLDHNSYDKVVFGCTSQIVSSDSTYNDLSSMPLESSLQNHQQNNGLTSSHASWDGIGSSNESSTGVVKIGDDISSICKPSFYDQQYHLHSLVSSSHDQDQKDEENDVSSLSRNESWSSTTCEQWALETLIGYCNAFS